MEPALRRQFLNEAVRIGDELLAQAERDAGGLFWKTLHSDLNNPGVFWQSSENIYVGVSGIVLFFLELYKQTQRGDYLNAAVDGLRWVEHFCQTHPAESAALVTGRMGVAYTLIKLAEVTRRPADLEKASAIARACSEALASTPFDDLVGGASGMLLGLLHVHATTGERWVLESIDRFAGHLIHRAHHGPSGLYWDRSGDFIHGLCGFSHGAAGVGFVFLELGHYFQNENFYWLAEQAFLYESHFFDGALNNWPDFRKSISLPGDYAKHVRALLDDDPDFFTQGGDMNAWCHGAAGIGLARLRAFELLRKPLYADEAKTAVEKTRQTTLALDVPHTMVALCHGLAGNAELFLEAYRVLQADEYHALATAAACKALNAKAGGHPYLSGYRFGQMEDRSLFMGNAGLGYFYLRLLEPHRVASVLAPRLEATLRPTEDVSDLPFLSAPSAALHRTLAEKIFKRTLFVVEALAPEKVEAHFQTDQADRRASIKETVISFLEDTLPDLPTRGQGCAADVFTLEREKLGVDEATRSHARTYIKDIVQSDQGAKLANLADEAFLGLKFMLDPEIRLVVADWDWELATPGQWLNNLSLEPQAYPVLLKPSAQAVTEVALSSLSYLVLAAFEEAQCVEQALQHIVGAFGPATPEQATDIQAAGVEQIKRALRAGILVSRPDSG